VRKSLGAVSEEAIRRGGGGTLSVVVRKAVLRKGGYTFVVPFQGQMLFPLLAVILNSLRAATNT